MKIIDLSVPLNQKTPVYPGDPKTVIKQSGVFEKDGFNDHLVSVGTHVGTHIDAPFHMLADGKTLDQIPVEQFVGRGVYIKVDGKFDLEAVRQANLRILFTTVLGILFLSEDFILARVAGGLLILAAIFIVRQKGKRSVTSKGVYWGLLPRWRSVSLI